MPRKKTKKVEKVRLADLLGKERKANAELHTDNPEKRALHLRHRTPRHRLITPTGAEYQRTLAGDVKKDLLLNELAREYISNGMRRTAAVAAVFGLTRRSASCSPHMKHFDSSWFRAKLAMMMMGTDGELADLPKEYAIQRLVNVLEMNILDYIGDDGRWLTVEELKALPLEMQTLLEDFRMVNTSRYVALKTADGEIVRDAEGEPHMIEIKDQTVHLKLPSKHKAAELLSKIMQWIQTHTEYNVTHIDATTMIEAESRIKELERDADDIEGEAERVASD